MTRTKMLLAASLLALGQSVYAGDGKKPASTQVAVSEWRAEVCAAMKTHENNMARLCAKAPTQEYVNFCRDGISAVQQYDKGFCGSN